MSMEDALDGVLSYYVANLSDALATIEAARSVTIPRWKDIDTTIVKSKQYPNISIVPATTAFEYGELDNFMTPWNDHNVGVVLAHSGSDQKEVQLVLMRYVEAIETLSVGSRDNYQYGGLFETVQLDEVAYSIEVAVEEKSMVQATIFSLIVRELGK